MLLSSIIMFPCSNTHLYVYQCLDGKSCDTLSLTKYKISTVKVRIRARNVSSASDVPW